MSSSQQHKSRKSKYDRKAKGQEQSSKADPTTGIAAGVVEQAEYMSHENVLPGEDQRGRPPHRKGHYERGKEPRQEGIRYEEGGMAMDERPKNSLEFDYARNQSNESSQPPGSIDQNNPKQYSPALRRHQTALDRDTEVRERNKRRRPRKRSPHCVIF